VDRPRRPELRVCESGDQYAMRIKNLWEKDAAVSAEDANEIRSCAHKI